MRIFTALLNFFLCILNIGCILNPTPYWPVTVLNILGAIATFSVGIFLFTQRD